MMLTRLITKETSYIELEEDLIEKIQEKKKIIGDFSSSKYTSYLSMIYKNNNNWYFFKENLKTIELINELLGSYMSKKINLPVVSYNIAKTKDKIGIASMNFKDNNHNYYYPDNLPININLYTITTQNIDNLQVMCMNQQNIDIFLNHLLKLLSLDLYMIQSDRHRHNIQFSQNIKTGFFDIAPLYDFESCKKEINVNNFLIPNAIMELYLDNIKILAREYPEFYDILKEVINIDMTSEIEKIFSDYKLNQDCSVYQKLIDYYEIKQNNQRKVIKKFLK